MSILNIVMYLAEQLKFTQKIKNDCFFVEFASAFDTFD